MATLAGAAAEPTGSSVRPDDWLIDGRRAVAEVREIAEGAREVVLENQLIRLTPNAATVAYDNLMTGQAELRSVRPEARVMLDGHEYDIGGLVGQPIHNYMLAPRLATMTADPSAFRFVAMRTGPTRERFAWQPRTAWLSTPTAWPPPGRSLELDFAAPEGSPHADVRVTVISAWLGTPQPPLPAAVVLPRDQLAAPPPNRVGCDDRAGLLEEPSPNAIAFRREPPTLVVVEPDPLRSDLLSQHSVLLPQLLDDVLLLFVEPSGAKHRRNLDDRVHPLAYQRPMFHSVDGQTFHAHAIPCRFTGCKFG